MLLHDDKLDHARTAMETAWFLAKSHQSHGYAGLAWQRLCEALMWRRYLANAAIPRLREAV